MTVREATAADGAYDDGDAAVDCEALNRMARRQAENHAGTMMFDTVDELMAYLESIAEKEPEG